MQQTVRRYAELVAPPQVIPTAVLRVVPDPPSTLRSAHLPSSTSDVHDAAPSESEILAAQAPQDGSWTSQSGALHVCDIRHLRLRLCIVAHQGSACPTNWGLSPGTPSESQF
jgi:hypothetical protein